MDAIEKRARFEAWRKSKYPNQPIGPVRACGTYWRTGVQRDWEVWQKAIAALTPPEDYVVVPADPTAAMIAAAEDAHMPFGDMGFAISAAISARPEVPGA